MIGKLCLLIVFFLSAGVITCFCQGSYVPFAEDSAQWSIQYTGYDTSTSQNYIHTYQLKMRGDTIINGLHYNKLYKSLDLNYFSSSDSIWCFQRQDTIQKKVFVKYPYSLFNDTNELILYDYSLQYLDTFVFRLIGDTVFRRAVVVNDNDSILTNYGSRRLIDLQIIDNTLWGPGCDDFNFIEGIGNNINLLYVEMPPIYCFFHTSNVQCYNEKGLYVLGGSYCDFNTTIQQAEEESIFILQHNKLLRIINPINIPIYNIMLIDMFSNKIFNIDHFENIVDLTLIHPGLYIIIINSKSKIIRNKILIH